MKALIFRETGEPKSVLELVEIPTPPLAPGEALVRVLLSPINASDLHMVRGRYGYQPELPASPGIEGVGIVEALGPGVQAPGVQGGHVRPVESSLWCSREARSFIVNPYSRQGFCNLISIFARFQRTRLSSVNASMHPICQILPGVCICWRFVGGLSPIRKIPQIWVMSG
jgi:threonine dehydrogenase-like Zn-dependent dehydrogenase